MGKYRVFNANLITTSLKKKSAGCQTPFNNAASGQYDIEYHFYLNYWTSK